MRTINKGPCPPTILAARNAWLAECAQKSPAIPPTATRRIRFDDSDKKAARRSLVREQVGLCAFCLGRIWAPVDLGGEVLPNRYVPKAEDPPTILAHVIPLSVDHLRILDWDNLLGACSGGTVASPHCDRSQGQLALHVNPAFLRFPVEQYIAYTSRGVLRYDGPTIDGRTRDEIQREFDDTLNLNCTRLKANRATVIDAARRRLPVSERQWTAHKLEGEIKHWSTPGPDGYSPYFCAQVSYLSKKLRAAQT